MDFLRKAYGKDYAANSRETIRRFTIHQFEQARIVDRNPDDLDRPTNSPKTVYALTEGAAEVLRAFGSTAFDPAVIAFLEQFGSLKAAYDRSREARRVPLRLLDGSTATLSPGEHNMLQVAVIEEFAPASPPEPRSCTSATRRRSMSSSRATISPGLESPSTNMTNCPISSCTTRSRGGSS